MYTEFQDIDDVWISTPFHTERVKLDISLDIDDISLMELFNYLILNEGVPLATINNYYKILKDYVPNEDWTFSEEDILLLKVSEREQINTLKFKEYTDVRVTRADDIIHAFVKLNIIKGNLPQRQFINRVLEVFKTSDPIVPRSINETEVSGVFYYPRQLIDSYVFADLVMNDPTFSYLINIDESTKATKKKSDSSQPWLYIHFDHPVVGHVTASITQKIVSRGDQVLKDYDTEVFPIGQAYVRVKITKARDITAAEKFIEIFSKLLVLYDEKYDSIVEEYLQYIPGFGEVEEEEIEEIDMTKPKNIAPEVFVENYSRSCKEDRYPTIIDEEKVDEYKEQGLQVMKYPRDVPKNGREYASDGVNQQYYVCLHADNKYPGLQDAKKLSNYQDYPVVPCCFATNQMNKPWKETARFYQDKQDSRAGCRRYSA
jgi:hypothetical protein